MSLHSRPPRALSALQSRSIILIKSREGLEDIVMGPSALHIFHACLLDNQWGTEYLLTWFPHRTLTIGFVKPELPSSSAPCHLLWLGRVGSEGHSYKRVNTSPDGSVDMSQPSCKFTLRVGYLFRII